MVWTRPVRCRCRQLVGVDVAPNVANCAIETLFTRISQPELLGLGLGTFEPAAMEFVSAAANDCGISDETIDQAVTEYQAG